MYAAFLTTSGASYRDMLPSSLLYTILPARRLGGEHYPLSLSSERRAAGSDSIHDMARTGRVRLHLRIRSKVQSRFLKSKKFPIAVT